MDSNDEIPDEAEIKKLVLVKTSQFTALYHSLCLYRHVVLCCERVNPHDWRVALG
jgi:hypothetical protein